MHIKENKYPPAVVSYMSYSGLGIVRSLGRKGIPVYALDPNKKQIGMNSRFCKSLVCPSLEENEKEYLDFLVNLSKNFNQKPVLFLTGDNTVTFYAKYEHILDNYFLYTGPSGDIIQKVVKKDDLFNTARGSNTPVPETYIPKSLNDVKNIVSDIPYPCIIKPIASNSWHKESVKKILADSQKVIPANNPQELIAEYERISRVDPDVIISEVVPGDDSQLYYFVTYISRNNQVLGKFAGRKVRLYPIHFGSASFVESAYDKELEEVSLNLLKSIGYRGLCGIEFKRDPRDNRYKLIEINARYGLWDVLGRKCGVDTALLAYLDAVKEPIEKINDYKTGVKWICMNLDIKAYLAYKNENALNLSEWMQSLSGEKEWAVYASDDMMPAITFAMKIANKKISKIGSRLLRISKRKK